MILKLTAENLRILETYQPKETTTYYTYPGQEIIIYSPNSESSVGWEVVITSYNLVFLVSITKTGQYQLYSCYQKHLILSDLC